MCFLQKMKVSFSYTQSLEKKLQEFKAASEKMLILTENFLFVFML